MIDDETYEKLKQENNRINALLYTYVHEIMKANKGISRLTYKVNVLKKQLALYSKYAPLLKDLIPKNEKPEDYWK